jgi:enamine deaminase RidA (YjgF/YER057c/UK114 family)
LTVAPEIHAMLARALALLLLSASPAFAQTAAPTQAPAAPVRIPSPGGEVLITTPGEQRAYDSYKFAPARRVGDTLYISGVIAGVQPGGPADAEAFKVSLRRAFQNLQRLLRAAGADFQDVAMINTFHVWDHPQVPGGRDGHFAAFSAVKDEFMRAPHPAWTAVGTTGLLSDGGLVEIQMIARVPGPAAR